MAARTPRESQNMNQRAFLATTLSAGATASANASPSADTPARQVAPRYRTKADLPTPALLLDLGAFEANLKAMAEQCKRAGCGFRPHAKTHKCPEIARRQVQSGALGVCVATVAEAEVMVAAGIRGVLLTSPIVERAKIERMVELARKGGVLLAVGDVRQVEILNQTAGSTKTTMDVLIDIDVGDRRTGVLPGKPALELARLIGKCKNLRLRGLQAYAGHASHVVGFERRQKMSREAMARAVATCELLIKAGFKADILSGGSTGTYNIDSTIAGVTELQVGSYVFMDVDYRNRRSQGPDGVFRFPAKLDCVDDRRQCRSCGSGDRGCRHQGPGYHRAASSPGQGSAGTCVQSGR